MQADGLNVAEGNDGGQARDLLTKDDGRLHTLARLGRHTPIIDASWYSIRSCGRILHGRFYSVLGFSS